MSLFQKQLLSYIVTIFIYGWFLPWPGVAALTIGVGWHEYGHLWAAKRVGMETKGFFLIPFVGGLALTSGPMEKYSKQAFFVLMGPVAGGLLAVITYAIYIATGSILMGQIAYFMAFLNLFNLLPLSILDGGQLLESILYSINEKLGMIVMAISSIIAIFVALFSGVSVAQTYQKWKMIKRGERYLLKQLPKAMTVKQILLTISCTIVTAAVLSAMLFHLKSNGIDMALLFKK